MSQPFCSGYFYLKYMIWMALLVRNRYWSKFWYQTEKPSSYSQNIISVSSFENLRHTLHMKNIEIFLAYHWLGPQIQLAYVRHRLSNTGVDVLWCGECIREHQIMWSAGFACAGIPVGISGKKKKKRLKTTWGFSSDYAGTLFLFVLKKNVLPFQSHLREY